MTSAAAMASIHARCFDFPWSEGEFAELLHTGVGKLSVEVRGSLAAFLLYRVVMDECEILTLATNPDHRRKGCAKALIQQLQQQYPDCRVFLEVRESNQAAQALYQQCGFTSIAQRKAYYRCADGNRENAVVMEWRGALDLEQESAPSP